MPRLSCCCRCSALSGPATSGYAPSHARPAYRSFATSPPLPFLIGTSSALSGRSSGTSDGSGSATGTSRPPLGSIPSSTRTFSSTSSPRARHADNDTPVDLTFPRTASPSPLDIFHFPRASAASLTRAQVKSRYLDLVKLYHPDRAVASGEKGKGKEEADERFKQIVAAYELLADPKRRETYLRTGLGWGSTSGYGAGAGGGAPSPWSQSTAEYHFRRGRPMSSSTRSGAYAYDWASSSDTWSDPFNPHFRPHYHSRGGGAGMSSSSPETGWKGQGAFGTNGLIFVGLAAVTLLVTPLTAWHAATLGDVAPPLALGETGTGIGEAWAPRVYDGRHRDAAKNLQLAREEARVRGPEKLEAIRRRVRELQREQAYDRAVEVETIERQQQGTGHLSLPAPPSPPAPPPAPPPTFRMGGYVPPSDSPPAPPRPRPPPALPPPASPSDSASLSSSAAAP